MTSEEENGHTLEKPYKVTIWRVQKGYVRYKLHADSIEAAVKDWEELGRLLRNAGEAIEGDKPEVEDRSNI
jgi:hypothetical protein